MNTPNPTVSTGRGLVWSALALALLPLGIFYAQMRSGLLVTPWYVPIITSVAALVAVAAAVRLPNIWRLLVGGLLITWAGLLWLFLNMAQLPPYSGPAVVGQPLPAFTSKLANGETFDQSKVAGPQKTAVVFFRGRWCPVCMMELAALEERHEDFARRNVRVLVVSLDNDEKSAKTQTQFPHLTVVADGDRKFIDAVSVVHEKAHPEHGDAAYPTTFLIDEAGVVRWIHRTDGIFHRMSPDEHFAEMDRLGWKTK